MSTHDSRVRRLAILVGGLTAAWVQARVARGFFEGLVGEDLNYFLPRLLDGAWWRMENGPLAVPWFTPSFCGGLPRVADGQDLSYALPQLLTWVMDPLAASYATAVAFALLGGVGFGALLARGFGASASVSLLGGVVVGLNAAHEARSLAGHLAYHGMMLVPWACLGVVAPLPEGDARRWRLVGDVALVGVVLAYLVGAGMLNMGVPLGLAVLAVALVHALHGGASLVPRLRDAGLRLGLGSALALALCAAKLSAFAGYYSHFRRDWYTLPGVPGVLETVSLAARSVFGWWAPAGARVVNTPWATEAHELTYGVGPLPAVGMAVGALAWARGRTRLGLSPAALATLGALAVVALVPLAVNVYTPGWNAFLERLPVISSSSLLLRWWLFYVFVAPLGLLGLERLSPRARDVVVAAGVALTLAGALLKERPSHAAHAFDASHVVRAWETSRRTGRTVPVTAVSSARAVRAVDGSRLVLGESHQRCYEPTFGYRLERFPRGPLHAGPVTDVRAGVLNLKNPACYVWPRENGCAPGDHFRVDQLASLQRFAARRPFRFEVPTRQRVANAVTAVAWAGVLVAVAALTARRALLAARSRRG